jgi:hypothetical protein
MNLIALVRPPFVWLLVAEVVLLGIVGSVGWHVWQQRVAPIGVALAPPASSPRPAATPAARGRPPLTTARSPSPPPVASAGPMPGPTPGIRTDAQFLSRQMVELNRVESALVDLEWRVTSAVVGAIQSYVARVVLPAVETAERGQR